MSGHTATVEVLTAEVRVLMVGSRQVTLSVARQLDWVSAASIEPFGRISLGDTESGWLTVIGSASGVLARAAVRQQDVYCAPTGEPHGYICGEHRPTWDAARSEGTWPDWDAWGKHLWTVCWSQKRMVRLELWDQLYALPLIVLAGLR